MFFEVEVALISGSVNLSWIILIFPVLTKFADITKLRRMLEKLWDYDSVSFGLRALLDMIEPYFG